MKVYLIIWILFFSFNARADVNYDAVAVVLSYPEKIVNYPAINFYGSIVTSIGALQSWSIMNTKEIHKYLHFRDNLLGTIPAFNRKDFIRALSLAKDFNKKKIIIPDLQRMLDTLALRGAIIVDCLPQGEDLVMSCGIYYYDRTVSKIIASAQKKYKVGIKDAGRWATKLVLTLKNGMTAAKFEKNRKKLDNILSSAGDKVYQRYFQLGAGITGNSVNVPSNVIKNHISGKLEVINKATSIGVGLELGYGLSNNDNEDNHYNLSSTTIGLLVNSSANALEHILWELDFAVGYSLRTFKGPDNSFIKAGEVYLDLRPGVLWKINLGLLVGVNLEFRKYLGGNIKRQGSFASDSLNDKSFGLGFMVKKNI